MWAGISKVIFGVQFFVDTAVEVWNYEFISAFT